MRRSRSTLLSPLTLSALILSILITSSVSFAADRINGAIAPQQLVKLSAGVSSKAKPEFDRGPVDPSFKLAYMTLLTVPSASQQKAITQLLAQQQDPHSPLYHQWLTSQQYADRFGLSVNDIQKLTAWLQSQGFTIDYVPSDRNWIAFSGTAAQVENAFKTSLHNFELNGKMHYANTVAPSIPSALSGIVTGIRGLNDFRAQSHLQTRAPQYSYPVSGGFNLYLAPGDIETIYDIGPLYTAGIDGTGQKLAVMGRTDVYLADLNDFRSGFGLSSLTCTTNSSNVVTACSDSHFQYVLNGPDPGVNPFHNSEGDDLPEADLDIEWSGAIAYNAQIIYVNSGGTVGDVFNSFYYTIANDLAPVITMSYGICELGEVEGATLASDESELQLANSKGITFMSSSGDSGAAGCDASGDPSQPYASGGLAVNYPASSPEVTGVGGTMIPFSEYDSTYWATTNVTNGGSLQCQAGSPCVPEGSWDDAFEIGAYCAANGCKGITDPQTAQAALGIGATGGGASNCTVLDGDGNCQSGFSQPVWQTVAISGQTSARFVPDVALLASPDLPGYIWCTQLFELGDSGSGSSCAPGNATGISNALGLSPGISVVGGTSASTPVFAAIVTLLNHYLVKNHIQASAGLGNINPNLYQSAINNPSAFNQIVAADFPAAPPSNQVYCEPGTPSNPPAALQCPQAVAPATEGLFGFLSSNADTLHVTGYNLATGLGSVNANELFSVWSATLTPNFELGFSPTPSSTLVSTNVTWNGTLAATNSYNKAVTLSCGTGAPTTCTFSPSVITPTAAGVAFTVTVGSGTAGAYNFNIVATDGTITNTAAVSLAINHDFTVTAAPLTPPTAPSPGQSTTTTMMVAPVPSGGTFTSNITFSCSAGLPAGSTCSFNPAQISAGTAGSQLVTVTIQTAGPFTGSAGNIQRRGTVHRVIGQKQPLWIPFTLPLAGIVLFGIGGRLPRRYKIAGLCLALAITGVLVACGGGGSSTPPATTVTPASAQVQLGATQQFAASTAATWSLSSGAPGSINSSGLYTAPTSGTTPVSFTVTATPTGSGTAGMASVTIPIVSVAASPSAVNSLYPNLSGAPPQTQQFTATVSNSTANQTVNWAVTGGSANGTINASGLYTAPAALPSPASVTVTATSAADPSKSGSATVNLLTPTPAGTSSITITAAEGTDVHTTTFSLTVN